MSRFDGCLVRDAEGCDLVDLAFVDAFGVVGTASCILAAAKAGEVPRVTLPAAPKMREHLAGLGFLGFLCDIGQEHEVHAAPSGRGDVVVPLTRVASVFEAEQLSQLLWANATRWDAHVREALSPRAPNRPGFGMMFGCLRVTLGRCRRMLRRRFASVV